jgi:hypothetical protein
VPKAEQPRRTPEVGCPGVGSCLRSGNLGVTAELSKESYCYLYLGASRRLPTLGITTHDVLLRD